MKQFPAGTKIADIDASGTPSGSTFLRGDGSWATPSGGGGGGGAVDSVNGQTGDVTLAAADVGAAATSHTHAAADITSGVIATARLGTGSPDENHYLRGDGAWFRQLMTIPFHADGTGPVILTNQANATQFLANSNSNITKLDLTRFSQVKLTVMVSVGSASANSPAVSLRYSTTYTTTASSYLAIGTSAVSASLATSTLVDTGWIDLAAGAKAEVFVAIIQTGGDGAADPRVGMIHAHFR